VDSSHYLPHDRLEVYHAALELARVAVPIASAIPSGYADLPSQITRSALAVVRHIAEGAGRREPADKRNRFVVARAECGECASAVETAAVLSLASAPDADAVKKLAGRIAAMLTGLIRREDRRSATKDESPATGDDPTPPRAPGRGAT